MLNLFKKDFLRERLWLLFILSIPFDSFPLAPGGVIKPLSLYPALMYFFFFFRPKNLINKDKFKGLVFVFFLIFQSFIYSALIIDSFIGSWKFLYNIFLIFVFIFIIGDFYKNSKRLTKTDIWHKTANYLVLSSYLPIILGLMQLIFPLFGQGYLSNSISLIFVNKLTERIQLSSSEPAFASIYLLVLFIFGFYFSTGNYRKVFKYLIPVILFLFLAVGSAYGLLLVLVIPVIYVFLFRKSAILKVIFGLCFVLILFYSVFNFLPEYTQSRLLAILSIISDVSVFQRLITVDDSIFLRIINPYIGFLIFKESYFLGVGGENSYYLFPYFILNYYPQVAENVQIWPIVSGEIRTSPKNLYSKILAEFGFVFGFYIFYQGYKIYKSIKFSVGQKVVFCMFLSFSLQIDSYSFPLFVLILTMLFLSRDTNNLSNS